MPIFSESLYLQEQGHRLYVLTIVLFYFIIFHYRLLGNGRFHGIIEFNLLKIYLLTLKINQNINLQNNVKILHLCHLNFNY